MAYAHIGPVTMLAMSPTKIATALDLSYPDFVAPTIRSGELACYIIGTKRCVLVEDVVAAIRSQKKVPNHG